MWGFQRSEEDWEERPGGGFKGLGFRKTFTMWGLRADSAWV